jgi:hypothetical protein
MTRFHLYSIDRGGELILDEEEVIWKEATATHLEVD